MNTTGYYAATPRKGAIIQLWVERENGKQTGQWPTGVTYKSAKAAEKDITARHAVASFADITPPASVFPRPGSPKPHYGRRDPSRRRHSEAYGDPMTPAARIARMLEAAAAEPDWRVKWTKVNRAAGVVCGIAVERHTDGFAPIAAQRLVDEVGEEIHLDPKVKATMVEGLAKRVALGLLEWGAEG